MPKMPTTAPCQCIRACVEFAVVSAAASSSHKLKSLLCQKHLHCRANMLSAVADAHLNLYRRHSTYQGRMAAATGHGRMQQNHDVTCLAKKVSDVYSTWRPGKKVKESDGCHSYRPPRRCDCLLALTGSSSTSANRWRLNICRNKAKSAGKRQQHPCPLRCIHDHVSEPSAMVAAGPNRLTLAHVLKNQMP